MQKREGAGQFLGHAGKVVTKEDTEEVSEVPATLPALPLKAPDLSLL